MGIKREPRDYVYRDRHAVNVEALKTEYCCGCSACANVCRHGAITMVRDEEGYLVPHVDNELCVGCMACVEACPVLNNIVENEAEPVCYAVMADDETRQESTAGGAFSVLANYVLDKGGYVCGAKLDEKLTVRHEVVHTAADLDRLRGTKYVQSDMGDSFSQVRELLEHGEKVLFSGCPCQVAGLKGFLGETDCENLITVDLVCHGAPSQKVFDKYIDDVYGKDNVKDFSFRTKEYGYSCFNQIAHLKDGIDVPSNFSSDPFEKVMHRSMALKEICGDCPFAEAPRQADFSMGDLFGAARFGDDCVDDMGTSTFLVNNDKAAEVMDEIKSSFKFVKEIDFDLIKHRNRFGRFINIPRNERRWLFNCIDFQPFEKVVKYSDERRFDVGVIGLWYGRNYGSMATYYALHQVLSKKYHLSVFMIENPLKPEGEPTVQIANDYYDISRRRKLEDMASLNNRCDTFIVGSDQLWNIWLSRPYKQMYYLDFVDEYRKRIAYGTSFGIEYKGTREERLISGAELRKFDHVSVRDDYSKQACRELFGVQDVVKVLDPTLICPVEEYRALEARSKMTESEEYILAYILDTNREIGGYLERLSQLRGKKVVVLLDEPPWEWEGLASRLMLSGKSNVEIKRNVGLYEWLWFFSHAESVVTDSFHGTIFSLINKKPFLTLSNARRGAQRFVSLLAPLGLEDRLFQKPSELWENIKLLKAMDYTEVDRIMDAMREESYAWLENALFSPKQARCYTVYDIKDTRTK